MILLRSLAFLTVFCGVGSVAFLSWPQHLQAQSVSAATMQEVLAAPAVTVGALVLDRAALNAVYTQTNYALLWGDARRRQVALSTLEAADAHGLVPSDYHVSEITAEQNPQQLDLLLTDALMRYASDVRVGRVSPRQVKGERFSPSQKIDPVAVVLEAAKASDLKGYLEGLPPQSPVYRGLQMALAKLRSWEAQGEWPKISEGSKLEPGKSSPRVVQLRKRLAATGELAEAVNDDSPLYDDKLAQAVRLYQDRSGLEPDGVVGRATVAALNVPLSRRIAQVKANMERLRWQPAQLGSRYVFVNIPAYQLVAVADGKVQLNMKVIVGRPKRPSPVFADLIRMVEFNPDWHVPPTIAREDVLPHLIEDPNYALEHKNVRIYQAGVEVDPHTVDWTTANIRDYRLRAEPGPRNPLGTVKFLFPNRFDVYLHDTNERELFRKDVRAISSGCIRVADPAALTNWLLTADRKDWSEAKRTKILDSRKQTRLILNTPVPVYLSYITAWMGAGAQPVFRDDIYNQDGALIAALAAVEAKSRRAVATMVRAGDGSAPVNEASVPAEELQKAAP